MHILFIAHYFQPEPNFFFALPFAEALVKHGHSVEVITGLPNYPRGRIYEGYRKISLLQREVMNGITVMRTPLYPSHDRSSLKRILSYSSLSLTQACIGPLSARKADVAYVCQGPATIGLPAVTMKWIRKIPFVYHIQDLWPDSLTATGMFSSNTGIAVINKWCNFVYSQSGKIVVISPGMKSALCSRGVPESKISVVYNWCDEVSMFSKTAIPECSTEINDIFKGKFNIVYAGNIGKAQALDSVIAAAEILERKKTAIQFVLIGEGVEKKNLQHIVEARAIQNVKFIPHKPVSEINILLDKADVLLVHLANNNLFKITIPSKIQAYLAAGKPILAGVPGDAANLVKTANAGLPCEPEDPQDIAAVAEKLSRLDRAELQKMGINGREFYQKELSADIGINHFINIFEEVATANIH